MEKSLFSCMMNSQMRGWRNGSRASLRNWWSNPWRFESSPAHMLDEASKAIAADIWESIKTSQKILLHCHISPDGDSIGSTLAMYHALKGMGKDVTAIWGDTGPVQQFSFLPGFAEIVNKHFFEPDLNEFDLFIIQDSGSIDRISMKGEIVFPATMKTIVIDHHISNTKYGQINLVPEKFPSTAAILYQLFVLWNVPITKEMAIAMMIGTYTDTGGFRFREMTPSVFEMMAHLYRIEPRYPFYIEEFEKDIEFGRLAYLGLAYSSIEMHCGNKVAMSVVAHDTLEARGIPEVCTQKQPVPNMLKSIRGAVIGIECVEGQPGNIKFSFRTRDPEKYDVSKLATMLGGGGHKAASGVLLQMPLEDAKKKVLDAVGEMFPDLR